MREKLKLHCDVISGYAFSSSDWKEEGIPVIKIGNISNGSDIDCDELQYLDVFKYLKRALADYASDDGGLMPVKDVEKLLEQLYEAIDLTRVFCLSHNVDLGKVVEDGDTFKNLSIFEDYANIIVGNDDVKNEFCKTLGIA